MGIMPEGETLRKAIRWISEKRGEQGGMPLYKILEEASVKYNLSPADEAFLQRFFSQKKEEGT